MQVTSVKSLHPCPSAAGSNDVSVLCTGYPDADVWRSLRIEDSLASYGAQLGS